MAYSISISASLGSSKTGLTLNVQLVNVDGSDNGSPITTGFVEIGNGNYLWSTSDMPTDFRGGAVFYEQSIPDTILAFCAINPEEVQDIDTLQSDINTIQTNVTNLQTNVSTMQTDISTIQTDVTTLQAVQPKNISISVSDTLPRTSIVTGVA